MTPYSDYVREVARRFGVREDVALAMVEQESGWNPERVSKAGAIGLTQLMPATAAERGVDPWNWQQNVEGGIGYLGDQIKRFGSVEAGLSAYNGGPGRFDERGRDLSRMPEETRNYVPAVMARTGKYAAMQQNDPWAELEAELESKFQGAAPVAQPGSGSWDALDQEFEQKFQQAAEVPRMNPLSAGQSLWQMAMQNAARAAGVAMSDLGTGFQQRMLQGTQLLPDIPVFAPLIETSARRLQDMEGEIARAREEAKPILSGPGGTTGYLAGAAAPLAAASMIPGANTIPGAVLTGAAFSALQPTAEGESATENAIFGGLAGGAGQLGANLIGKGVQAWKQSGATKAAAEAAKNAVRDDTVRTAVEAGYRLPPAVANPGSFTSRFLQGVSGKNATGTRAAQINQGVTDDLARKALGAAPDEPLTPQLIKRTIQNEYQKGYEPIKKAGAIQADQQFNQTVVNKWQSGTQLAQDFPNLARRAPEVEEIVSDLAKGQWDAANVVDAIRRYRFAAKENFKALGNPDKIDLARLQRSAATELENLLERNLQAQGKPGLVAQFRASRQKIAIAEDIDNALVPSSGSVDARYFGNKSLAQEPLSGETKIIGDTESLFRRNAMTVNPLSLGQGSSPFSPWDLMTGGIGLGASGVTGNPAFLALSMSRPALREAILSGPYQRSGFTIPQYGHGTMTKAAQGLLDNDLFRFALRSAGPLGYLTSE